MTSLEAQVSHGKLLASLPEPLNWCRASPAETSCRFLPQGEEADLGGGEEDEC